MHEKFQALSKKLADAGHGNHIIMIKHPHGWFSYVDTAYVNKNNYDTIIQSALNPDFSKAIDEESLK